MADELTNIYLEDLVYYKSESNAILLAEQTRVNALIDKKADIDLVGTPSGICPLDADGDVPIINIPIAINTDADDENENEKLMTPEKVHYVLRDYNTKAEATGIFGDIKSDGSVTMFTSYNPQSETDLATVKFVQDSVSGTSHNFIVNTLAEMLVLVGVKLADTCFVIADTNPDNNAEYRALKDDPAFIEDWNKVSNSVAWGSIIGLLSDQTDLQAALDLKADTTVTDVHTGEIAAIEAKTDYITVTANADLDVIQADIATLEAPKTTLTAAGHIPAVLLEVENGGAASLIETTYVNDSGATHSVSSIQWVAGEDEADWTLSNKDTGVTETMFRIIAGGKATVGTGLSQSEIMTVDTAIDKRVFNDMTGASPVDVPGQIYYANNTLNLNTEYGTTLNIGKELTDEVYNNTGALIHNGRPVIVTGLANGLPSIELAQANTFSGCDGVIVTTMDIPAGTSGAVTTYGKVNDLNLSGFNVNDKLYVSETTAGVYTTTPPDIATYVGKVYSNDAITGSLYVKPNTHINLPTILAYMNDGALDTNVITAAYQKVSAYSSYGNVVMEYDPSPNNGTITTPSTGVYTLTINLSFLFDTVGNAEESFNLRLVGSDSGNWDIPITVPRNGGSASAYPKITFDATAGEVFHLELGGATDDLTNLNEQLMSFEIISKHIR